ncbi:MAG: hypothetical protein P8Z79_22700 [Sedimentisphaerales bacterium]|jgi:hypothetical protein
MNLSIVEVQGGVKQKVECPLFFRDAVSLDVELPPSTDHGQPAYALKIEPIGTLYLK